MNIGEVKPEELDILIAGLGELPSKISFNLINRLGRIRQQAMHDMASADPAERESATLEPRS